MSEVTVLRLLVACGILWTVFREVQFAAVRSQAKSIQGFLRQIIGKVKTTERNTANGFERLQGDLDRLSERLKDLVSDMRYDRALDIASRGSANSAQATKIYNHFAGHGGDTTEIEQVDIQGGQNNIGKTEVGGNQQQHGDK